MAVTAVKTLKQGPRKLLQVDLEEAVAPIYPARCPCCGDAAERGVVLRVPYIPAASKETQPSPLRFPSCQVCVRHVPFFARLSDVMGYLIFGLTIVTMGVGLVAFAAYSSGKTGWEVVYVGLKLPFRGLAFGLISLLIAGAVMVAYAVVSGVLITMPLYWILAKRRCQEEPVKAALLPTNPRTLRLTFENLKYAAEFVKANGGEPAAGLATRAAKRSAPPSHP